MGSTVTFWSSRWSASNSLSGGTAPASFKGYENRASAPSCGGTWTASTGNSGNPPAAVPQTMSVLVTSSVGQNGSSDSGNVRAIAVVQVSPGYAGNAGHEGTGKVLAIIRCS
ncbi:MAG TPA: hypothetical protein VFS62_16685 [Chloroflexota bacterium]|nr:hypothetical protein [Chloroflexota bacterium]